jgi:hypothetical protein
MGIVKREFIPYEQVNELKYLRYGIATDPNSIKYRRFNE